MSKHSGHRSIRSIGRSTDRFDRFDRFDIRKHKNFKTPLFGELSRTSRDSFESESDSKESWDIRLNSSKSGICIFCFFFTCDVDSTFEKRENLEMPLFGELSRSSRDSFESDSDSKESRDVRLYSPKSGISIFSSIFDSIDSIICSVRSIMCPGVDGDRPVVDVCTIVYDRNFVRSVKWSTRYE